MDSRDLVGWPDDRYHSTSLQDLTAYIQYNCTQYTVQYSNYVIVHTYSSTQYSAELIHRSTGPGLAVVMRRQNRIKELISYVHC